MMGYYIFFFLGGVGGWGFCKVRGEGGMDD